MSFTIAWDNHQLTVQATLQAITDVDQLAIALQKAKVLLPNTLTMGQQFERSGIEPNSENALRQMTGRAIT